MESLHPCFLACEDEISRLSVPMYQFCRDFDLIAVPTMDVVDLVHYLLLLGLVSFSADEVLLDSA